MEELRGEIKPMIYGDFVSQVTRTFARMGVAGAFAENKRDINQNADFVKAKADYLNEYREITSEAGLMMIGTTSTSSGRDIMEFSLV